MTSRGQGLTLQLFFFILLPLAIVLFCVLYWSLTLHQQAMRTLVGERDARAVKAASTAITEQLLHRTAALRGLALHAAQAASPEQALADYNFILNDFDGGLVLIKDSKVIAASPNWKNRSLTPEILIEDGNPLMIVSAASGGVTAVGAFSPSHLAARALADAFPATSEAFTVMVDRERRVLYQAGKAPTDLMKHAGLAEALRGESGSIYLSTSDGEHVVAYSPIAPTGWALMIEEPWEAVDNPVLRTTQAAPLILIPILLFALVALGFGIRQIVQPLQLLEKQAAELGWGKFEAIEKPVGGIAEIHHLQAQLILMAHKVKAAQKNLRGYVSMITAGQEDERRRIARELHDDTVQSLVALDQRTQLAQLAAKNGSADVATRLSEIRGMTTSLMDEVRRIIRVLRPIYLEDLGLLPAIEMLARDLEKTAKVQTKFVVEGQARRLTSAHEIAIYRIVQEALNNIARSAEAQHANVKMMFDETEFVMRIEDDGKGFVAPERVSDLVASGHYGLMGMQERAELIGAQLSIRSAPGDGTLIEVRLP
ncbi:MAG: histidine kinase [Chloroflexota bacterium]